jgi:hypothetical protein
MGPWMAIPPAMNYENFDAKLPDIVWEYWPKTHYGASLLFFHNVLMKSIDHSPWYGYRPYPLFQISDQLSSPQEWVCSRHTDYLQQIQFLYQKM